MLAALNSMNIPNPPALLGEVFTDAIRQAVAEGMKANGNGTGTFLDWKAVEKILNAVSSQELSAAEALERIKKSIVRPDALTPEQLAERISVPVSWVYEQSRQEKIPTHRIGRYIRFDLAEVLASQKKE
jgi:excisionase family DNA binding protein